MMNAIIFMLKGGGGGVHLKERSCYALNYFVNCRKLLSGLIIRLKVPYNSTGTAPPRILKSQKQVGGVGGCS